MNIGIVVNVILLIIVLDLLHFFVISNNIIALALVPIFVYLACKKYDKNDLKFIINGLILLVLAIILGYYVTIWISVLLVSLISWIFFKKAKSIRSLTKGIAYGVVIGYISIIFFFALFYHWYIIPFVSYQLEGFKNIREVITYYNMSYGTCPIILNPVKKYVVCRDIARINYFLALKRGQHPKYILMVYGKVNGYISVFDLVLIRLISKKEWHTFVISDGYVYDFYVVNGTKIVPIKFDEKYINQVYYSNYSICEYEILWLHCYSLSS